MASSSPSRTSDLSVPVNNMTPSELKDLAYHKKYIDPSEPKDHELQAMWSRLVVAQDNATTEEEKLSVKRQKQELKAAAAERLRELRSEAALTPPLRRLTATEAKKMEKKIKKRRARTSKWVSENADKLLKAFQEYMKKKKEKENV